MGNRSWVRVLAGVLVVATVVGVATYTYNLGVARGITESARLTTGTGGTAPVVIWTRPWGFGFGFFPFFPLVVLFWLFVARGLFWRGAWRGRGCRYDAPPEDRQAPTPRPAERTT